MEAQVPGWSPPAPHVCCRPPPQLASLPMTSTWSPWTQQSWDLDDWLWTLTSQPRILAGWSCETCWHVWAGCEAGVGQAVGSLETRHSELCSLWPPGQHSFSDLEHLGQRNLSDSQLSWWACWVCSLHSLGPQCNLEP